MDDQKKPKNNRIPVKTGKKSKVLDFATRLRSSSRENTGQLKDSLSQLSTDCQTENSHLKRPIHHISGKENVNLKSKELGNRVESSEPLASVKENQKIGQKTGLGGFLKTKLFKRNFQQVVDSKLTEEKPTKCFQENPPNSPRSRKDLYIKSLETKTIPSPKTIRTSQVTVTNKPLDIQSEGNSNGNPGEPSQTQSSATIDEGPIIRKAIPVAKEVKLEPSPVIQKKDTTTKTGIPRIPMKATSVPYKPRGSLEHVKPKQKVKPSLTKSQSPKKVQTTVNKFGFSNNSKSQKPPITSSSDNNIPVGHSVSSVKSQHQVPNSRNITKSFGFIAHDPRGKSNVKSDHLNRKDDPKVDSIFVTAKNTNPSSPQSIASNKPTVCADGNKQGVSFSPKTKGYQQSNQISQHNTDKTVPVGTLNSDCTKIISSNLSVDDNTPMQSGDKLTVTDSSNQESYKSGTERCQIQSNVIILQKSESVNIENISTTCYNSDRLSPLNFSQNQHHSEKQSNLKKSVSFSNVEIGSYHSNPHLESDSGQVKGILKKSLDSVFDNAKNHEPPVRTILKKSSSFTHGQKHIAIKNCGLRKSVSFNLGKNTQHLFPTEGDIEPNQDKTAITSQKKPNRSESQDIRESPEFNELPPDRNVPQTRHDTSMAGQSQYGSANITPSAALKINYVGFLDNHLYEYSSSSSDQDSLDEVDYLPPKQDGVRYAGTSCDLPLGVSSQSEKSDSVENSGNSLNTVNNDRPVFSKKSYVEAGEGLQGFLKKRSKRSASTRSVKQVIKHRGIDGVEKICEVKDIPGPKIIYFPKMESTENKTHQGKDSKPSRRVSPTARNVSPSKDATGQATNRNSSPCKDASSQVTKRNVSPRKDATGQVIKRNVSPCKNATGQATKRNNSPCKDATGQVTKRNGSPCKDATSQVTKRNVSPSKDATGQVIKRNVSPSKDATGQVIKRNVSPCKNATGQATKRNNSPCKDATGQVTKRNGSPCKDATSQVTKRNVSPCKDATDHVIKRNRSPCKDATSQVTKRNVSPCKDASSQVTTWNSSPCKDASRRVSPTARNVSPTKDESSQGTTQNVSTCKDASNPTAKSPTNVKKPTQSKLPCKEKAKPQVAIKESNKGASDVKTPNRCTTGRSSIPRSNLTSSPTNKMAYSDPKSPHRCLIPKINQPNPIRDNGSRTPEGQNDKILSDCENKHYKFHSNTSPCKLDKQRLGGITAPLSRSHGNSDRGQVTSSEAPVLLVNTVNIKTSDRKPPGNRDSDGYNTPTSDCHSFITSSPPQEVGHVLHVQGRNDAQKAKVNLSRRRIPTGIPSRVTPQKTLVADDKTNNITCVNGTRGINDNKNIRDNQLREDFDGDKNGVSKPSSVIVLNNGGEDVKGVHRDKNVNLGEQLSSLCNVEAGNNDVQLERNVGVKTDPEQIYLDFSDDSIEFDITRENREGLVADKHSLVDKYSNLREIGFKTGDSYSSSGKIVKQNKSNISTNCVINSDLTDSSRACDTLVPNQEFSHSKTSVTSEPRSKSKPKIVKPINRSSPKPLLLNSNTSSKIPTKSNTSVQGHDIRAKINAGKGINGTCGYQKQDMEVKCAGKQTTTERIAASEVRNDKCEATDTPTNQLQTRKFTKKINQHGASCTNLPKPYQTTRDGGIKTGNENLNSDELPRETSEIKTKSTSSKITGYQKNVITSHGTKSENTDIGNTTLIARASQNNDVTNIPGAFSNENEDNNLKVEGKHPITFTRQTKDREKVEGRNEKRDQTKKGDIKDQILTETDNKSTCTKVESSEIENVKEKSQKEVKVGNDKFSELTKNNICDGNKKGVSEKTKGTKLPKRQTLKRDSDSTGKNGLKEKSDVIKDRTVPLNNENISVDSTTSLNLHVRAEKSENVIKSDKKKNLAGKEGVLSETKELIKDVSTSKINQTKSLSTSKTSSDIDLLKVDHVNVSPSRIPIKKGSKNRENNESPNQTLDGYLTPTQVSENTQSKLSSPCKSINIQTKTKSDYLDDKNKQSLLKQKIKSKPTKSDFCDKKLSNKDEIFSVQSTRHKEFTQSLSMSDNKLEIFDNKCMNNKEKASDSSDLYVDKDIKGNISLSCCEVDNKGLKHKEGFKLTSSDLHEKDFTDNISYGDLDKKGVKNKDLIGNISNSDCERKGLRKKGTGFTSDKKDLKHQEGFVTNKPGKTLVDNKQSETIVYQKIKQTSPVEIEKEELTKSQLGLLSFSTELSQTDNQSKIEQLLSEKHNSVEDNSQVLNISSRSPENNHSDKPGYFDKEYFNNTEDLNSNVENKIIDETCVENYATSNKTHQNDNLKNVNGVKNKSKTKFEICDKNYLENLKRKSEKISSDFDSNLDDDSVLVCENGVMRLVDGGNSGIPGRHLEEDGLHSDNKDTAHHMEENSISKRKGNKHGLVDQLTGNFDQKRMANDNRFQPFTSGSLQSTQGISGDHSTNNITAIKGRVSNRETSTDKSREKTLQEQAAGVELKKADDSLNECQGNDDLIEGLSSLGHHGEIESSDIETESFNNKTPDNENGTTIAERKKKKSTQNTTECSPKSGKKWDSSPKHIRRNVTSPQHARKSDSSPKHIRQEQQILKKSVSVDERGHEELTLTTKLERLSRGLPIYDKKSPEIQRRAKSASPDMADKRRKLISPSRQPTSPRQRKQPKRPSDVQISPECPKDSKSSPKRSPTKTSQPGSPTHQKTNSNPSSPKGTKKTSMEPSKTKKNSKPQTNSSGSRIPTTKKINDPDKIKSVTICERRCSSQSSTRESSVEDDRMSKTTESSLRSEISSKLSSWTTSAKTDGTKLISSSSRTSTRENSVEDDRMSTNSDTSFPSFSSSSKSSVTESKSSRQIPVSKTVATKNKKTSDDSYTPSSTRESSVESQLSFASDISSISSVSTSGKSSKFKPRLGTSIPTTSTPNKNTTGKKIMAKTSVKQNGSSKKLKSTRMPAKSERESSIESQVSDISQVSSASTSRLSTKPGVKTGARSGDKTAKGSSKTATNTKTKPDVKKAEGNNTRESSVESQASDVSHISSVSTSHLPTRTQTKATAPLGKTTFTATKATKFTSKTKVGCKSEERDLRESSVESQASDISQVSSVSSSRLLSRQATQGTQRTGKTTVSKSKPSVKSQDNNTRESSVESQASDISHISSASASRLPTRPGTKTTTRSTSSQVEPRTGKTLPKSTASSAASSKNGGTKSKTTTSESSKTTLKFGSTESSKTTLKSGSSESTKTTLKSGSSESTKTTLKTGSSESTKTTTQGRSKIAVAATKVLAAKKFESNLKASREKKKTTSNLKAQVVKTTSEKMGNQSDSLQKSDATVVVFNSNSEHLSIIKPDTSSDSSYGKSGRKNDNLVSDKTGSVNGKLKRDSLKSDIGNVTSSKSGVPKSDAIKSDVKLSKSDAVKNGVVKSDGVKPSKSVVPKSDVKLSKSDVIKRDVGSVTASKNDISKTSSKRSPSSLMSSVRSEPQSDNDVILDSVSKRNYSGKPDNKSRPNNQNYNQHEITDRTLNENMIGQCNENDQNELGFDSDRIYDTSCKDSSRIKPQIKMGQTLCKSEQSDSLNDSEEFLLVETENGASDGKKSVDKSIVKSGVAKKSKVSTTGSKSLSTTGVQSLNSNKVHKKDEWKHESELNQNRKSDLSGTRGSNQHERATSVFDNLCEESSSDQIEHDGLDNSGDPVSDSGLDVQSRDCVQIGLNSQNVHLELNSGFMSESEKVTPVQTSDLKSENVSDVNQTDLWLEQKVLTCGISNESLDEHGSDLSSPSQVSSLKQFIKTSPNSVVGEIMNENGESETDSSPQQHQGPTLNHLKSNQANLDTSLMVKPTNVETRQTSGLNHPSSQSDTVYFHSDHLTDSLHSGLKAGALQRSEFMSKVRSEVECGRNSTQCLQNEYRESWNCESDDNNSISDLENCDFKTVKSILDVTILSCETLTKSAENFGLDSENKLSNNSEFGVSVDDNLTDKPLITDQPISVDERNLYTSNKNRHGIEIKYDKRREIFNSGDKKLVYNEATSSERYEEGLCQDSDETCTSRFNEVNYNVSTNIDNFHQGRLIIDSNIQTEPLNVNSIDSCYDKHTERLSVDLTTQSGAAHLENVLKPDTSLKSDWSVEDKTTSLTERNVDKKDNFFINTQNQTVENTDDSFDEGRSNRSVYSTQINSNSVNKLNNIKYNLNLTLDDSLTKSESDIEGSISDSIDPVNGDNIGENDSGDSSFKSCEEVKDFTGLNQIGNSSFESVDSFKDCVQSFTPGQDQSVENFSDSSHEIRKNFHSKVEFRENCNEDISDSNSVTVVKELTEPEDRNLVLHDVCQNKLHVTLNLRDTELQKHVEYSGETVSNHDDVKKSELCDLVSSENSFEGITTAGIGSPDHVNFVTQTENQHKVSCENNYSGLTSVEFGEAETHKTLLATFTPRNDTGRFLHNQLQDFNADIPLLNLGNGSQTSLADDQNKVSEEKALSIADNKQISHYNSDNNGHVTLTSKYGASDNSLDKSFEDSEEISTSSEIDHFSNVCTSYSPTMTTSREDLNSQAREAAQSLIGSFLNSGSMCSSSKMVDRNNLDMLSSAPSAEIVFSDNVENSRSQLGCQNSETLSNINNSNNQTKSSISSAKEKFFQTEQTNNVDNGKTVSVSKSKVQERISKMDETTSIQPQTNNVFCVNSSKTSVNSSKTSEKISKLVVRDAKSILTVSYCDTHISSHIKDTVRVTQSPAEEVKNAEEIKSEILSQSSSSSRTHKETTTSSRFYIKDGKIVSPDGKFPPINADEVFGKLKQEIVFSDKNPSLQDKAECDLNMADISNFTHIKNSDKLLNSSVISNLQSPTDLSTSGEGKKQTLLFNDEGISGETNLNDSVTSVKNNEESQSVSDTNSNYSTIKITSGTVSPRAASNWNRVKAQLPKFESSKMSNNRNGSTLNLNSPEVNERIVQLRQSAEKFAQARCSSPPLENRFRRVAKEVMVKSGLKKDMMQTSTTGNTNLHKTDIIITADSKSKTVKTKTSEHLMPKGPSLVKSKSTGSDYKKVNQKQSDRKYLGDKSGNVRPKSPLACDVVHMFKSSTLPRTLINKSSSQTKTQQTVRVKQKMGPGPFPVGEKSCDNLVPSETVETSVNPTMVLSDYDNLPKPVENVPLEIQVVSKTSDLESQIQHPEPQIQHPEPVIHDTEPQGQHPEPQIYPESQIHHEVEIQQPDKDNKTDSISKGNKSDIDLMKTSTQTSQISQSNQDKDEIIKDFPSDPSSTSDDTIDNDQMCNVELKITEEDLQSSESDSRNQSFEVEPEDSVLINEETTSSVDRRSDLEEISKIGFDEDLIVNNNVQVCVKKSKVEDKIEPKGMEEITSHQNASTDDLKAVCSDKIIPADTPEISTTDKINKSTKLEARDETQQSEDDPEIKMARVKRFKATKALWKKTVNQVIISGKSPEVCEAKVETVIDPKSTTSPGKDKVQNLRNNLSCKLATPVSGSPLTSPLANRKYQWVKGEGGIWKKEYLDVPWEGSTSPSPSSCGSPMRTRSVSLSPVKTPTPISTTLDHQIMICDNLPVDTSITNTTNPTGPPEIVLNVEESGHLSPTSEILEREPTLKSETISEIPSNLPSREPVQSYQQKMVEFDKIVNMKPGEIFHHNSSQSVVKDNNQIPDKVENKNMKFKQRIELLNSNSLNSTNTEESGTSDEMVSTTSEQIFTKKSQIFDHASPAAVNKKVKKSVDNLKSVPVLLEENDTNKSDSNFNKIQPKTKYTGSTIIPGNRQTDSKIQDVLDNGVESVSSKNLNKISPEKCLVANMQIPVKQKSETTSFNNDETSDLVTLTTDLNEISEREKVPSKQTKWHGAEEDILPSPTVYMSTGTTNNQTTDNTKLLFPRKTHPESAIFMSKSPDKQLSSSLLCDLFSPPGVVVPRRLKKQGKTKNLKLLTEGAVRCPSLVLEESYSDEEMLDKPDVKCSIVLETDFSSCEPVERITTSPQKNLPESNTKLLSEIAELEESSTHISSEQKKGDNSDLTSSRRQKNRKSVRRSLSLPSGQLSYNDNVKITYVDGHFVTDDPETYSSEYNVSHSNNGHLVDNQSETETSPSQSSGDINSMRDEILSLLNKGLSTSENAFWDQNYDWNFNHVPEDSDTKSGLISCTLPRRRRKDGPHTQRPLSVDDIKLWRHSSHSETSLCSDENDPSESSHGDDISITSSKYDSQYSSQLSVDETGKRSKSPNFFKRMLSKRKSFSEKSKTRDDVFAPGSTASLTRRMSFRSFFKRKNSSISRKDSDSEDPNSPPIVGFLTNEDIGAISLPNSPHIYKKPGQTESETGRNHIEIIRHNSVPCDTSTLSHNASNHPTSHTNQSDYSIGNHSSNQPPPKPSSAKPEISPRRKGSVCSLRQAMGVSYDRSSGEFGDVDYRSDVLNSEGNLSPPSISPNSSMMYEGDVTLTDGDRTITGYLPCVSPGDREKLMGELTGSNSNDSGIQHDLHLQSSADSLQKVLDEVGSISSAVRLRKSPSPARERPKSDTTYSVRFADLLEQVCEEDETYFTKDGKQIRRKPRPKSDIDDLIIFSRSLSDDDITAEDVFIEGGSSIYTSHMKAFGGSMGNLRPSDSLRSLVEMRRQQEHGTKSMKQVKNRRMSTPHPIKSRTNKKSTKSHNRHDLVRSHSMPESLDQLHRRRNFLSLIGGDTSSIYSQSGGDCDSSDESEISVDFNHQDKSSRSNRGSQLTLATLEEFIEEENLIYAEALWDHVTMDTDEMGFRAGDLIRVTDLMDKDWWFGMIDDRQGWFPATFVRLRVNQAEVEEELTMLIQEETENVPKIRHHGVSYIDKNQARANVVNEIINAEREYSKHLKDVVEGYVKQARKRPEMFPEEKIETMFGNIEDIYSFASKFLLQLESKINSTSPHLSEIGSTFLDNSKRFEIYSDYCNNHPSACDELKDLYRNKRYRHFFEACRLLQDMIEIPLEGFLLTPVQKICKYHLQLAELLKYTPLDHPDYPHVKGALEAMKKIATLINERKRKMESIEKIATWQMSVDTWEGDDLLDVSSELIYSGELHKINSSGWSQERYFFLFDHQLVYCKKDILKKNSFCYKGRVNLDHCEIIPLEDGKDTQYNVTVRHAWKLHDTRRDKWYLLVAKSDSVKQRWLKAFQDERQRVKDDQENNFNIPEHIRQTAIHNVKQKTNLHRSKGKRKLTKRSASFKIPSNKDNLLSASAMATLPRTPRRQDSNLSNISQSKKLTWFFLSGKKTK